MGDRLQYWEGKARFGPAGAEIEVFVDGSSHATMEQQHLFFDALCARWPELRSVVVAKIEQQYGSEGANDYTVTSLSIPDSRFTGNAEWDVSVETQPSGSFCKVQVKGSTPERAVWDI